jgi:hypothetical protein
LNVGREQPARLVRENLPRRWPACRSPCTARTR